MATSGRGCRGVAQSNVGLFIIFGEGALRHLRVLPPAGQSDRTSFRPFSSIIFFDPGWWIQLEQIDAGGGLGGVLRRTEPSEKGGRGHSSEGLPPASLTSRGRSVRRAVPCAVRGTPGGAPKGRHAEADPTAVAARRPRRDEALVPGRGSGPQTSARSKFYDARPQGAPRGPDNLPGTGVPSWGDF